ncbi:MAG TPA: energy transducer TonB [Flavobacteriales bacterium]
MRHELELMELVDRYLRNELNADERMAFTERLHHNTELRQLVEDQRALHAGMERLVLRNAVDKAYRSHRFGKWMPGIGGAVLIVLLATGSLLMTSPEHEQSNVAPAKVSADTSNVITNAVSRNVRTDTLQQTRDTIVRTEVRVVRRPIVVYETTSISEKEPDLGIVTLRDARSEELPSYPGGFSAMHAFLQRNIRYPDTVLSRTEAVTIEFLVDVDGSIQEVQVTKGIGKLFDREALRVVGLMPKWIPAKENGRPVKARIEVPIRFTAVSVEQEVPGSIPPTAQ